MMARMMAGAKGAVTRAIDGERTRVALWLPVMLGIGIAIYFGLPVEPPRGLGWVLALPALAMAWRHPSARLFWMACLTICVGLALAQHRTHGVAAPVLADEIGPVSVTGTVVDLDRRTDGVRIRLANPEIGRLVAEETPAFVRIKLTRYSPVPTAGETVRLRAVLSPPGGPAVPGGYDFARRAWFDQLGAVGYAVSHVETVAPGGETGLLERWRAGMDQRIAAYLAPDMAAIASALLTGERGGVPEDILEDLRVAGMAHLLAISGLHVGLMAGIAFFVVRALLALWVHAALYWPVKKLAAIAGLGAAVAYTVFVGAPVPTQRATLMIGIVFIAVLMDRRAISMRSVAIAALVILALTPEALLGASFQLSFAAVIALVAGYEWLHNRLYRAAASYGPILRPVFYLAGVSFSTVLASAATAAAAIYHFQRLPLTGGVGNLLAVPAMGFVVMPGGALAIAGMPFGLEQPGLMVMGWGIGLIVWSAEISADLPLAAISLPTPSLWSYALLVAGGLWLCLWQGRHRLAGLVPIVAGSIAFAMARPPDLFIAEDGRLVAAVQSDQLSLSSLQRGRFVRDQWAEESGLAEITRWPRWGVEPAGEIACDDRACRLNRSSTTVTILRSPSALAEACRESALVISEFPVRAPCAAMVIDRDTLARTGAVSAWLEDGEIHLRQANSVRHGRPWAPVSSGGAAPPDDPEP